MADPKSCTNCGQKLSGDFSGALCPSCKEKCEFKNVTCYTPECGGPGNVDPRL